MMAWMVVAALGAAIGALWVYFEISRYLLLLLIGLPALL